MFKVDFAKAHKESGYTMYRVSKDTGVSMNTTRKYLVNPPTFVLQISKPVISIANYLDVDWKDIVEFVEVGCDEANPTPGSSARKRGKRP